MNKKSSLLLLGVPGIIVLALALRIPLMMGPTAYYDDIRYWHTWAQKIELLGLENLYATDRGEIPAKNQGSGWTRLWELVSKKKEIAREQNELFERLKTFPGQPGNFLKGYLYAGRQGRSDIQSDMMKRIEALAPDDKMRVLAAIAEWNSIQANQDEWSREVSKLDDRQTWERLTEILGKEEGGKARTELIECNYPPAYAYVLRLLPPAYHFFAGGDLLTSEMFSELERMCAGRFTEWGHIQHPEGPTVPPFKQELRGRLAWHKIPAVLADILTSLFFVFLGFRLGAPGKGILAGALYAVLPPVLYESAVWGQVDSIHTFFMLVSLFALMEKRIFLGWWALSLGLLMKFQAVILLPLIGLWTLFLWIESMRNPEAPKPPGKEKSRDNRNVARLGIACVLSIPARAVAGLAAPAVVVCLPWLAAGRLGEMATWGYIRAVGTEYSRVTINAFNLWWLALKNVSFSPWTWQSYVPRDDKALVAGLSPKTLGLLLLLIFVAAILFFLWRARFRSPFVARGALLLALSFFVLPTEMHERYLFPALAFSLLASLFSRRFFIAAGILSLTALWNLAYITPLLPEGFARPLAALSNLPILHPSLTRLAALLNTGLLLACMLEMILAALGKTIAEDEPH